LSSVPLYLNTRNPNVKTVKDFTDKSKIALPAIKVSTMAIVLQMAAEKAFGPGNHTKLDHLTISRSHPDGMAEMLSEASEIDSHFSWPPYQYRELKRPGVHTVLSSNDVMGGAATTVVVIAPKRFRDANPKIFAAFVAAMQEADDIIKRNRKHAAEVYLQVSKDKDTVENIETMLAEPGQFSIVPEKVMKYVEFMYRTGMVKQKPASWKDLFFPEVHHLPGS
jgi:sulfonate transport system substrate-binding protein